MNYLIKHNVDSDRQWMQRAFELAERAWAENEVPVGAIVTLENKIIGEGWNQPITTHDPTAHAEMIALQQAGRYLGNYRLLNTTLYVTLEPCAMCAVAAVHARIQRLVFGAFDPKTGAAASVFQLLDNNHLNHRVAWSGGIMAAECGLLLKNFFHKRR